MPERRIRPIYAQRLLGNTLDRKRNLIKFPASRQNESTATKVDIRDYWNFSPRAIQTTSEE